MKLDFPGDVGLIKLTAAILATFVLITLAEALWSQWIFGLAGVIVGWIYVLSMIRRS